MLSVVRDVPVDNKTPVLTYDHKGKTYVRAFIRVGVCTLGYAMNSATLSIWIN